MALSDIKCRTAKAKDKAYKLSDGDGLYLFVKPNGSKLWRLKYYFLGKEKTLSFGGYPLVTLLEAREEKNKAKKLILQGIDPSQDRKNKKAENLLKSKNTFQAVALEWIEIRSEDWSKNYTRKVANGLKLNVFPAIGHIPLQDITPPILLNECLRKIEKRGALDIAARTRQICGQVFRYGIQTGRCEWNAAENLKGALRKHKKKHFRTIEVDQLPGFLKALECNEARLYERTRRAMWLSLYTFCRPGEIRQAQWSNINLDTAVWIIPAEVMKARRDHVVPLSRQVIQILKEQKLETDLFDSDWVFPSQVKPKRPMSDGTVNKAIKRLNYGDKLVAHGFRALARTAIHEKLKYNSDIIEKQLAHKSSGPLGEAYDRTQFLDERKVMMQDWADYINEQKR